MKATIEVSANNHKDDGLILSVDSAEKRYGLPSWAITNAYCELKIKEMGSKK